MGNKRLFFLIIGTIVFTLTSCNSNEQKSSNQNTTDYLLANVVEFDSLLKAQSGTLIDVRSGEEFSEGHIPNAMNIDINGNSFETEISHLDKSKVIYVYCMAGGRSARAAELLKEKGFKLVVDLDGGIQSWASAGYSISK